MLAEAAHTGTPVEIMGRGTKDEVGRPVAFGGRVINPDDNPKYLNSAESPIFHK